ncbi:MULTISPECIES: TRAP transporter large permease [Mammaliicoccus]|uniref:TRAP transporter large permease n=1 Tax=Mammaliicoccus TaxID=2803850 RepID=UPI001C4EF7D4|nr:MULTISPECIES: TRAP transporter large permease [Mammaliicoccus]MBW0764913.1 TRAP transporter large permease [Mammaliicoccus fleurettii]MEB7724227.1 TRAP transporter large permease [Mammaliicoccus fleurettii]MEB7779957.1 TRAP transporter large permease [Mammaliicoccus fleurettii]MEB7805892.1 TRAP transporter large permease [Mammaliicoccus fleurettii]
MILFLIILLFVLILLRTPIAFSLMAVSIIGIGWTGIEFLEIIPRKMYFGINNFSLLAIPLFVLAGEIMSKGGMSQRIVNFSKLLIGPLPGGLAMVVIISSVFFAALTGTAIAAAAAIGGMLLPLMKKEGYDEGFSSALVASASTVGPIIPPSIIFILFGVMANQSISDLFIGGIVPGILMGVGLMIYSYFVGKKNNYKSMDSFPPIKDILLGFKDAILALLMPAIIIGGIISGLFTATESGVIAVLYAILISTLVYKELTFKKLYDALVSSTKTSVGIIFLIGSAAVFIWFVSFNNVPEQIQNMLGIFAENPLLLLLVINIVLLIAGTFIDTISAVTIFTPIFLPLILATNIDPIHFGVVMAVNLSIGMITPPVGVCLFVVSSISKVDIKKIIKSIIPQLAILIVVLVIITYVPWLITYPVSLFK